MSGVRVQLPQHRKVLLGFLLTLALFEVLCRGPLPARVPGAVGLLYRKAAWIRGAPDVPLLIIGDSTGHQGLDAGLLGEAAGLPARNAAFPSGSPIVARALLPGAAPGPRAILFALSPLLLSDSWTAEPPEVDVATPRERVRLSGIGPGVLGSLSATYLRRHALRGGLRLALGAVLGRSPPDLAARDFGRLRGARLIEDERGALPVSAPPDVGPAQAEALLRAWLGTTPRAGARLRALDALAAAWQRDGVAVTYVLMPLHSALRAALSRHPAERDFQRRLLASLTARHGGVVLDCQDSVSDEAFHSPDHLRAGPLRDAFSRQLGAALRARAGTCPSLSR